MKETIPNMVAKILDTPYDFILGRPDIQKYDMLAKNMSQFHAKSNDIESMLSSGHTLKARKRRVATKESHTASSSIINTIFRKEELLTPEYDDDGITWDEDDYSWTDTDTTIDKEVAPGDSYTLATVAGTPELQRKLLELLEKYKHVFSEKLRPDAAKLNPMNIGVDKDKWQCNKNSLPPRPQSRAKNEEIERQLYALLEAKVIKISQAPWYSQVHIVPKTNGKWRLASPKVGQSQMYTGCYSVSGIKELSIMR